MTRVLFFSSLCLFSLCHSHLSQDVTSIVLEELRTETKCLDMLYGSSTEVNVSDVYLHAFVKKIRSWCLALTILKISKQKILERKKEIKNIKKKYLKNEGIEKLHLIDEAILKLKKNIQNLIALYKYSKTFSLANQDEEEMTHLIMKAQNDDTA